MSKARKSAAIAGAVGGMLILTACGTTAEVTSSTEDQSAPAVTTPAVLEDEANSVRGGVMANLYAQEVYGTSLMDLGDIDFQGVCNVVRDAAPAVVEVYADQVEGPASVEDLAAWREVACS